MPECTEKIGRFFGHTHFHINIEGWEKEFIFCKRCSKKAGGFKFWKMMTEIAYKDIKEYRKFIKDVKGN